MADKNAMNYVQPTPITSTPSDQVFEPTYLDRSPVKWASAMGFDPTGGTKVQPPGVDYARTPTLQDSSKDIRTGSSNKLGG